MRPVVYNDVLAAVAYVSSVPSRHRRRAVRCLIEDANRAERYTNVYSAPHPVFGDGTLIAAAGRYEKAGDTSFRTRDSLTAWVEVLTALLEFDETSRGSASCSEEIGSSPRS